MEKDEFSAAHPRPAALPKASRAGFRLTGVAPNEVPQIDAYHILDRLGEGGMGAVWRAVQISTRRTVAIKVIAADKVVTPQARQRFEREVELCARLSHPNIAQVYDSGVSRGAYYFAMEFIDGLPLDEFVRQRQLDTQAILRLIGAVCEAIQYAHRRGVIHRDLKPSNILVTKDGQPHVLDFGLAKESSAAPDKDISFDGAVTGTTAFMSPEQARGLASEVDVRTDVYSLASILYLLLVGAHPHDQSGSQLEIFRRIVDDDPHIPRNSNLEISRELEALLLKGLARDADNRYESAGALASDIENLLNGDPLAAKPTTILYVLTKRLQKHRGRVTLVAVLGITMLVMAVVAIARVVVERNRAIAATASAQASEAESKQRFATLAMTRGIELAGQDDAATAALWFVEALKINSGIRDREWADRVRLGVAFRSLPSLHIVFKAPQGASLLKLLPSDRWLVTADAAGRVRLVNSTTVSEASAALDAHRSTGLPLVVQVGSECAIAAEQVIYLVDSATGKLTAGTVQPESPIEVLLSVDGTDLVMLERSGRLSRWRPGSQEPVRQSIGPAGRVIQWSVRHDLRRLITISDNNARNHERLVQIWDIDQVHPEGDAVAGNRIALAAIDKQHKPVLLLDDPDPPASPAFLIRRMGVGVGAGPAESSISIRTNAIRVSQDGRTFAYVSDGAAQLLDVDSLTSTRVATPAWTNHFRVDQSPDGRCVTVFNEEGKAQVWDAATHLPLTPVLRHDAPIRSMDWSADGKRIATLTESGMVRIWDLGRNRSHHLLETNDRCVDVSFSNDSAVVAVASLHGFGVWSTRNGTLLYRPAWGDKQLSAGAVSPDGRSAFTRGPERGLVIWNAEAPAEISSVLINTRSGLAPTGSAFSPDGKTIVLVDGKVQLADARSGQPLGELVAEGSPVAIAFSADSQRLALLSVKPRRRSAVTIFSTQDRSAIVSGLGPANASDASLNDDGSVVSILSRDGVVSDWSVTTGKQLPAVSDLSRDLHDQAQQTHARERWKVTIDSGIIRIHPLEGRVSGVLSIRDRHRAETVFLSRSQKLIASTSLEGLARVWDRATGLPLTPWLPHGSQLDRVEVSPDDSLLLAASASTNSRAWDLREDDRPIGTLQASAELLSGHELTKEGQLAPIDTGRLHQLWKQLNASSTTAPASRPSN